MRPSSSWFRARTATSWLLALTNGVLQPVPLVEWYIASDLADPSGPRRTTRASGARPGGRTG